MTIGTVVMSYSSSNYATALWLPAGGTTPYICCKNVGVWGQWAPVALAEPPQEYNLQVESALKAYARYSRSQEGIVVLYADVRKSDGSALGTSATTVGTLPVGFRPASTVYASAVALDSSAGAIMGAAQIWVSQTGVVSVITDPQSGAYRVRGELVFPAG